MWPEGKRFAVAFTFDFDAEEVWLADDPGYAEHPAALSQGTYGPRVAVPLILELLERHDVAATFFVPGRVAERHRERVKEIVAAGHELACHGYTHRHPARLTADQHAHELARAREVLGGFGASVVGYRAPGWDPAAHTIEHLREHGFAYDSSYMDDVRPYLHEGAGVVELPVHWALDDAPHLWFDAESWTKTMATNSAVREIWTEELLGIRDLGGLCVLTMHPQVIGRPGRLRLLDAFLAWTLAFEDAWIARCVEIADRARIALTT